MEMNRLPGYNRDPQNGKGNMLICNSAMEYISKSCLKTGQSRIVQRKHSKSVSGICKIYTFPHTKL